MNKESIKSECRNISNFIVNDRDNFFQVVSLENSDFKNELIQILNGVFPEHKDDLYYLKIIDFLNDFFELSHDYNVNEWLKENFIDKKNYDSKWLYDLSKEVINSKSFLFREGVWIVSKACEELVYDGESEEIEELISDTKILAELYAEMISDPALYMERHDKNNIVNDIRDFLLKTGLEKINLKGVIRYIVYKITASKLPERVKNDYIDTISFYTEEIMANRLIKGRER